MAPFFLIVLFLIAAGSSAFAAIDPSYNERMGDLIQKLQARACPRRRFPGFFRTAG